MSTIRWSWLVRYLAHARLAGGNDFQVLLVNDFDHWQRILASKSNVMFHLYTRLSHIFMPEGKLGTAANYEKPSHVDSKMIADVAAWVTRQPAR